MKAIPLGAFGAALLASSAFAAPLNATTIGSAEVSNVEQVGLVCNEYYGRCWRTRGPRYVLRYYYDLEDGNWNRALARYNGSLGSQKYPNLVFDRLRSRWYQQ